MKVLCSPDSFKESISAADAALAMKRGVETALAEPPEPPPPEAPEALEPPPPEPGNGSCRALKLPGGVDCCPIADGGEGTVDAMVAATGGQLKVTQVTGPRGERVDAAWGMLGDGKTAVIEMAAASGLALMPVDQRDPMQTTTFGTGELIRAALDAGVRQIILGIGGSATNDGGCGAAQALGAKFVGVEQPVTGGMLHQIQAIELNRLDVRLRKVEIVVACDVTNPLTGPNGAAHIYGPQKGATPQQVKILDAGLTHLASLLPAMNSQPGCGASGGLGGGAVAMLGAALRRGIDLVLDAVNFDERVASCDLCLTGEGKLDGQSLAGKAIMGVTLRAKQAGVPTVALVGCAAPDADRVIEAGLAAYHVIGEGLPASESMQRAGELIEAATRRVVEDRSKPGIS